MYHVTYDYLRPKKAAALKKWYDSPLPDRELSVWEGENAILLPLRKDPALLFGRGGVVDRDGNYVELSCIPKRVQGAYPFETPQYRDETVVYCGYLVHHWGHFLVEGVARLWYFLESNPDVDKYVFLLNENEEREIRGNYREFLELLGIWDKLEFVSKPTAFRKVLVPELSYLCMRYCSHKYLDIFDRVAENAPQDPNLQTYEKIYFSRSQFQKGQGFEFGFASMDNFLEKNGYTILFPEKVSLSQMIHYIRNAKVVATLSGSAQHNMLFGNQGQKIEIFERFLLNNDHAVDICRIRELDVTYIDANIPIYTVDFAGPYIVAYNDNAQRFAADRGYAAPDTEYTSERFLNKCFKQYMASYKDLYGYRWYMADWYEPFVDYLREGYAAGYACFRDYLDGNKPFRWHHYFEFHYWKQFIKRLIKRVR